MGGEFEYQDGMSQYTPLEKVCEVAYKIFNPFPDRRVTSSLIYILFSSQHPKAYTCPIMCAFIYIDSYKHMSILETEQIHLSGIAFHIF